MTRRRHGGQAAVEALAALPVLVAVALVAWQAAALASAAISATVDARRAALSTQGPPGGLARVSAEVPVAAFLPGASHLRVRARAAVRAPG